LLTHLSKEKMKASLALAGLMALVATAQQQPSDKELAQLVKKDLTANVEATYKLLEADNKFKASDVVDMAKQLGWQVAGSLDGNILKLGNVKVSVGQTSTVGGTVVNGDYNLTAAARKDWVKNFGTAAMGFVPKVGALGNLPGFVMLLATIAGTIDRNQRAATLAKKAQEQACFDKGRTYSDLCNNCNTDLIVSVLGKLHNCSNKPVASRDHSTESKMAQSFCSAIVLCNGYNNGGTGSIIKAPYRYDPLRSFWCRPKEDQIGLLLDPTIGSALRTNLDVIDYDEFRNVLKEPCTKLLGDKAPKNKCPTKAQIQEANSQFKPINYCFK